MADEHDAWFKNVFGLDLGRAAQEARDMADIVVADGLAGGQPWAPHLGPKISGKSVEVDPRNVFAAGPDAQKAIEAAAEGAMDVVEQRVAEMAAAAPRVVAGAGQPLQMGEAAVDALGTAALAAVDSVQQGVAGLEAGADAAVDAIGDRMSEAIDTVAQSIGQLAGDELVMNEPDRPRPAAAGAASGAAAGAASDAPADVASDE